ncbi:MAG: hypothetical protein K5746_07750 [Clostridiales bacterium]|nr:hypothetical protein [Clostridiales bacterium]
MESETISRGFTFQNILPFLLAILLIFLLPMLMRRYGFTWGDITRLLFSRLGKKDYAEEMKKKGGQKDRREPWQSNGRSQDIQTLVSTLLILARRQKLGLVYPGTISHGGKMANLVALLVTKREVIGVNCFGFGGTITEGKGKTKGKWNQHMNGQDADIPDPVLGNQNQFTIVRAAMDAAGMQEIPLRVLACFTSRTVTLESQHENEVFDTNGFIAHLRECAADPGSLEPEAVSKQLNTLVTRIKR